MPQSPALLAKAGRHPEPLQLLGDGEGGGLCCLQLKQPSFFASKALGLLGCVEDPRRGDWEDLPVNLARSSPLSLCVLLYDRAQ